MGQYDFDEFVYYSVLPFLCVVSWGTTMAVMSPDRYCDEGETECQNSQTCWEGYTQQPYAYILSVPMTLALAVSFAFGSLSVDFWLFAVSNMTLGILGRGNNVNYQGKLILNLSCNDKSCWFTISRVNFWTIENLWTIFAYTLWQILDFYNFNEQNNRTNWKYFKNQMHVKFSKN